LRYAVVLLVAVAALATISVTAATGGGGQPGAGSPADVTLDFCASGGAGDTFTKVCTSTDGSLVNFESPAGYEHIGVGTLSEGKVLCYGSSAEVDLGGPDSWTTPATITPISATKRRYTRNTDDGVLNFSELHTISVGSKTDTIVMTVKNNLATSVPSVILSRQADADVDTGGAAGWAGFANDFRADGNDSVDAWNNDDEGPTFGSEHSLMLRNIKGTTSRQAKVTDAILDTSCVATDFAFTGPTADSDDGYRLEYFFGTLAPHTSKSVTVQYVRG